MLKKAAAFLLGILLVFVSAEGVTRALRWDCFEAVGSEQGRIATLMRDFADRDPSRPAVILLGGSDVREDLDQDLASAFFKEHGLQFFNFAISAHDPLVEKYQLLSALKLNPDDVFFFNIGYAEFNPEEDANPTSKLWETPSAFIERVRVLDTKVPGVTYVATLADRYLVSIFSWARDREPLRRCLIPKPNSKRGSLWHIYGDKPEEAAITAAKLAQYKDHKIDTAYTYDRNSTYMNLLRFVRAKYSDQVIFSEIPRNPKIADVYSPEFFARYYDSVAEFHLVRIGANAQLAPDDFFDFNHLNSIGSTHFTAQMLPDLLRAVQDFKLKRGH